METIVSKNLSPLILLSHHLPAFIIYTRVFQSKNARWVTDKYLVVGTNCPMTSGLMMTLGRSIDWQKVMHILRNA